ncbi:hypothetical protein LINGRAHAP2_LOCUS15301 [Linum grandiflorum]
MGEICGGDPRHHQLRGKTVAGNFQYGGRSSQSLRQICLFHEGFYGHPQFPS